MRSRSPLAALRLAMSSVKQREVLLLLIGLLRLVRIWRGRGYTVARRRMWLGQSDVAIEHLARAMRLSPLDPRIPDVQTATAHAHFIAGRSDEASSWAEKALAEAIFAPALRVGCGE